MRVKFRFVGDPPAPGGVTAKYVTAFGVRFPTNGRPIFVESERAIRKLRGNSHWQEVKQRATSKPITQTFDGLEADE